MIPSILFILSASRPEQPRVGAFPDEQYETSIEPSTSHTE
jgi:hypothetical protein